VNYTRSTAGSKKIINITVAVNVIEEFWYDKNRSLAAEVAT
jgi:hypothetical protein